MNIYFYALWGALLLGVFSQLILKYVANDLLPALYEMPLWLAGDRLIGEFVDFYTAHPVPLLLLGLGLMTYAISVLAWIVALKKYQLSRAYPFLSLGYVLVYLVAVLWPGLDETLSWNKSAGILLILAGVTLSVKRDPCDGAASVDVSTKRKQIHTEPRMSL